MQPLTRRSFLGHTAGWTGASLSLATLGAIAAPAPSRVPPRVRLGGPVFEAPADPDRLARAHRDLGYTAAYCPQLSLDQPDHIREVREAFARHGVVLAEVGRWVNLLDADPAKRAANLKTVTEGLALAEEVDALCCVDIAGSFSSTAWYGPHPDNLSPRFFDAAVENARKIIDAVKPRRARFCYEMMGWALPDSPDSYRRMLRAVDRKAFGVHLDPCNLINSPRRFHENAALLRECFKTLGRWIVSCHAKDLAWELEMNLHFREVRPGTGVLDYRTYLRELARLPQRPPLMLEHLPNAQEYDAARRHLLELGPACGVEMDPEPTPAKA